VKKWQTKCSFTDESTTYIYHSAVLTCTGIINIMSKIEKYAKVTIK